MFLPGRTGRASQLRLCRLQKLHSELQKTDFIPFLVILSSAGPSPTLKSKNWTLHRPPSSTKVVAAGSDEQKHAPPVLLFVYCNHVLLMLEWLLMDAHFIPRHACGEKQCFRQRFRHRTFVLLCRDVVNRVQNMPGFNLILLRQTCSLAGPKGCFG